MFPSARRLAFGSVNHQRIAQTSGDRGHAVRDSNLLRHLPPRTPARAWFREHNLRDCIAALSRFTNFYGIPRTIVGPIKRVRPTGRRRQIRISRSKRGLSRRMSWVSPMRV